MKILKKKYKYEMSNGYMDVITAPKEYYPDENRNVPYDNVFKDKPDRIK